MINFVSFHGVMKRAVLIIQKLPVGLIFSWEVIFD